MIGDFDSIIELLECFPDEQSCIDFLIRRRWKDKIISPFDETSKVYVCAGNKYRCKNTGKYFNVKTQTLFDNTKIKLRKWFLAIWLVTSHKKGISSIQLAKDIGIQQRSAWFMLQRIRNCFCLDNDKLDNDVEVDETYIGGKNKNRHKDKKVKHSHGRSLKDKSAVIGMVERGGRLIAKKLDNVTGKTLLKEIVSNVEKSAYIHTDEWKGYNMVGKKFKHGVVRHNFGEYVNGKSHTNTVEGFWSILKRGVMGIYHFTSKKHLQKYIDEFVFRYNTRNLREGQRFEFMLENMENKLTYKELIGKKVDAFKGVMPFMPNRLEF